MNAELYYEAHITIEPVFDDDLDIVKKIAKRHDFRVADLLMQKRKKDSPKRSKYDTFCTGHGKDYAILVDRIRALVGDLQREGFRVWRYKIEDTLIDSRIKDVLGLIKS